MPASCPTCHHLHPSGKPCGSPALRGEQFCFFHHPTRRPPPRAAQPSRVPFHMPPIVDHENLQIALSEIIRRLADNTLDTKRAGLMLASLQMAKANLFAIPDYPPEEVTRDSSSTTARSAAPDPPDLSELLGRLGLHPTHPASVF